MRNTIQSPISTTHNFKIWKSNVYWPRSAYTNPIEAVIAYNEESNIVLAQYLRRQNRRIVRPSAQYALWMTFETQLWQSLNPTCPLQQHQCNFRTIIWWWNKLSHSLISAYNCLPLLSIGRGLRLAVDDYSLMRRVKINLNLYNRKLLWNLDKSITQDYCWVSY